MGRRAIRRPDPNLDLSRHHLELEQLPEGWNAEAWFGRGPCPLEIEMGTGKGLFLRQAARGTPEHNFIGLEIAARYAEFAASQLARRQLNNALVIHGDGLRYFQQRVADQSLHAIHVYFPDPWWKKRHRKRRVLNTAFLADVQRTLRPGGILHFWTDVEEYFESTLRLIAQATTLEGPLPVVERPADHDLDYRTHFERRMRLTRQAVYRSEFRAR